MNNYIIRNEEISKRFTWHSLICFVINQQFCRVLCVRVWVRKETVIKAHIGEDKRKKKERMQNKDMMREKNWLKKGEKR